MPAAPLPPSIEDRVRRHRSRLTAADVEVDDLRAPIVASDGVTTVLLAGVVPDAGRDTVTRLEQLRAELPAGVRVRIVNEERPLALESAAKRAVERLRGREDARREHSVVEALRAAGWTVASLERITVDDEPSRLWVDLTAVDLSTITADSGEGDRDQRSE